MHAILTDEALRDLKDIWLQLSLESDEIADRVVSELTDRAYEIEAFPLANQVISGRERQGTRRVVVRTWVILYEVWADYIEVLRVVHGGRDLGLVLKER